MTSLSLRSSPAGTAEASNCQRGEENDADHKDDGCASRDEDLGRDAQPSYACRERHGHAPSQVAARAPGDISGSSSRDDDQGLDEKRTDNLEAYQDRKRQQDRKQVLEIRGVSARNRGQGWAEAV